MEISSFWPIALGLIALAAMFDRVLSRRGKITFLAQARRIASRHHELWLRRVFDKFFGARLFSWRALIVASLLTCVVWLVSAALPFTTIRDEFLESLAVNFEHPFSAAAFLIGCVILLVTSYYSLTQTRVFLGMLQGRQSAPVVLTVLIADFFASIAIFIVGFAVARLLCIFAVLAFFAPDPIVDTVRYSPRALVRAAEIAGIDESGLRQVSGEKSARANALADILAASRTVSRGSSAEELRAFANAFRVRQFGDRNSPYEQVVSFNVEIECEDTFLGLSRGAYHYLETSTNSLLIIGEIGRDFPTLVTNRNVFRDLNEAEYQRSIESDDPDCRIPLVILSREISMKNFIGSFSLGSLYLASFMYTASETFQEVSYKFSPYIATDANADLELWLGHAAAIEAATLFGSSPHSEFLDGLYDFADDSHRSITYDGPLIRLPLSIFMAGAIFTSGLLWLYAGVLLVRSSVGASRGIVRNTLPFVDIRKHPVTVFVLVTYSLLALAWAGLTLLKWMILLLF